MKTSPGIYQQDFRDKDGKRFSNIAERWVRFIESFRAARINAILPKGAILDIGCGRGIFLSKLKKYGWAPMGTELFEGANTIAEALEIPIKTGDLKELTLGTEVFDVVTLWHTLEHIEDLSVLKKIHKVLKENGILVVSVPNIGSVQARIFKNNWFHINEPYHIHHFSPRSLSTLLLNNGFSPYAINHFRFTYNFFGWLEGFIDAIFKQRNILFNELRKSSSVNLKRLMLLFLAALLAIPSLCALFVESAFRHGGSFDIYAKKA